MQPNGTEEDTGNIQSYVRRPTWKGKGLVVTVYRCYAQCTWCWVSVTSCKLCRSL